MLHRILFILLCAGSVLQAEVSSNSLYQAHLKELKEVKNDLRIQELLPNLLLPLAIDPAIPKDFIAATASGIVDPYDWIYWGPKDVLDAYFKDPDSLQVPLLRVRLSGNVAQSGPRKFSDGTSRDLLQKMKEKNTSADVKEVMWGAYPVLAVKTTLTRNSVYLAWVGLNDPESGWTLMFNIVSPSQGKGADEQELKLWDDFITNTVPLQGADYFKACGQDLEDGYTIVNVGGAKLTMVAEKRQRDGAIQVVVIPEKSTTSFRYEHMQECLMGAAWKYKTPMVKVYGDVVTNEKNFHSMIPYVTSIFYKSVAEFSFNKDEEKNMMIFEQQSAQKAI